MKRIAFLLALGLCACTNEDQARRVLKAENIERVSMTGYRFFICGDDYWYQTGFAGYKNGQYLTGAVCSGILKGAQLKFD